MLLNLRGNNRGSTLVAGGFAVNHDLNFNPGEYLCVSQIFKYYLSVSKLKRKYFVLHLHLNYSLFLCYGVILWNEELKCINDSQRNYFCQLRSFWVLQ